MVQVNGQAIKANYKIKPLDQIIIYSDISPEQTAVSPEPMDLSIFYEDKDVMIINKPAGMVVHPGSGNYTGTLLNGVAWYLQQQNPELSEETLPRFGMVHRIDKNTSGLLVLAKTDLAMRQLAKQFFDHTVNREYIALVTLVRCKLETGRTHQIRVHMKYLGHPLFNDDFYGGDKIVKGTVYARYKQFVENCFEICKRQALHARTLGFIHPSTGLTINFESPLPVDMEEVIEKWRNYSATYKK